MNSLNEFLDLLQTYPVLSRKIPTILESFSSTILLRSLPYIKAISFKDVLLKKDHSLLHGDALQIKMKGSSYYEVIFYPSTLQNYCSCPHANDGYNCKHSAAFLKFLSKHYEIINSQGKNVEEKPAAPPEKVIASEVNKIVHSLAKDLDEYDLREFAKQNNISTAGGYQIIYERILKKNFQTFNLNIYTRSWHSLLKKYDIPVQNMQEGIDVLKQFYVHGPHVVNEYKQKLALAQYKERIEKIVNHKTVPRHNPIAENQALILKIKLIAGENGGEYQFVQLDQKGRLKKNLEIYFLNKLNSIPKYISELDLFIYQQLYYGKQYSFSQISWALIFKYACPEQKFINHDFTPLQLHSETWDLLPGWIENNGSLELQIQIQSRQNSYTLNSDWFYLESDPFYIIDPLLGIFKLEDSISLEFLQNLYQPLVLDSAQKQLLKKEVIKTASIGFSLPQTLQPPLIHKPFIPQIQINYDKNNGILSLNPLFEYEGVGQVTQNSKAHYFTDENGDLFLLNRDYERENLFTQNLHEQIKSLNDEQLNQSKSTFNRFVQRQIVLEFIPKWLNDGWTVLKSQDIDSLRTRTGKLNLSIKSGEDWFELDPKMQYENEEFSIRELITLRNQGKNLISLKDGSFGEIDENVLKHFDFIYKLGESKNNTVQLSQWHASLLNDFSDLGWAPTTESKKNLNKWASQTPKKVPTPKNLVATLRPYQQEGLNWLKHLRDHNMGGILADDMGLGKTIQVISLLCTLSAKKALDKPVLIVAPSSIAGNWAAEIQKFAPHFTPIILHGLGREELKTNEKNVIYITTYGTLVREVEWLEKIVFCLAVLDESQAIRNHNTLTFKACKLIQAEQKLCLTGTPIENHLMDLWSQFSFLNPGLLGNASFFAQNIAKPAAEGADGIMPKLKAITQPFWIRRTKETVAQDLPDRENISLLIELDPKQQKLYNKHLKDYRDKLIEGVEKEGLTQENRFSVLAALLRLRQIACAPELIGTKGVSTKMDVLVEMLTEEIEVKHKALVFSSFTSFLDIAEKRFQKENISYLRIDGSTPSKKRTELVKQFQEYNSERVFLISLKAGGAGLNLTAADYVFIMDPWWNPASEEQAAARSHRIGQKNKVTVYRMIAQNTIEEKIIALSGKKAELAKEVFDKDDNSGVLLTAELIQELLR